MESRVVLLILVGLLSLLGSICNWDWFMEHRKSAFWIKLMGRTGTRIFYIIIGLGLIGAGVAMHFHIIG